MTWLYRSMVANSGTSTVPGWQTRPRSLRPRSTSITCSARSFGSASSSAASAASASGVPPRGRVPAIGCSSARRRPSAPAVTFRCASGDEPTMSKPSKRSRYMYGLGLVVRSTR